MNSRNTLKTELNEILKNDFTEFKSFINQYINNLRTTRIKDNINIPEEFKNWTFKDLLIFLNHKEIIPLYFIKSTSNNYNVDSYINSEYNTFMDSNNTIYYDIRLIEYYKKPTLHKLFVFPIITGNETVNECFQDQNYIDLFVDYIYILDSGVYQKFIKHTLINKLQIDYNIHNFVDLVEYLYNKGYVLIRDNYGICYINKQLNENTPIKHRIYKTYDTHSFRVEVKYENEEDKYLLEKIENNSLHKIFSILNVLKD